jgi:hypothetical protein
MGRLIVLDGPRCSGKSYFVDKLKENSKYEYVEYNRVFLPRDVYTELLDYELEWDNFKWGFVELMAVANMYSFDANIILDRGLLSWLLYNGVNASDAVQFSRPWIKLLRKWDYAKLILLQASEETIKVNSQKKDWKSNAYLPQWRSLKKDEEIYGLYGLIPDDLKTVIEVNGKIDELNFMEIDK